MNIFVSKHFGLDISGHRDIAFVDVDCIGDTRLFLDPQLIWSVDSDLARRCAKAIATFFTCVFEACENNDDVALARLLNFGKEPNETHLGLSSGRAQGKGLSATIFYTALAWLKSQGLFEDGIIKDPQDICVFAPNFAEDRMSDLCTNIIRRELYSFTASCMREYMSSDKLHEAPYWDVDTKSWRRGRWPALLVKDKPILLVPKNFVTKRYSFTAAHYLAHYAMEYQQEKYLRDNSPLCRHRKNTDGSLEIIPPTKKDIRREEGKNTKEFNTSSAKEAPRTMEALRAERDSARKEPQFLSDDELDFLVYCSSEMYHTG